MATSAVSSLLPKVNVSFSGCGFLGIYHVGSYACLKEHQERSLAYVQNKYEQLTNGAKSHSLEEELSNQELPCFVIDKALGASAGALVAAALVVDYPPERLKSKFLEIAKDVQSMAFGPFNPKFNVNTMFREELNQVKIANTFIYFFIHTIYKKKLLMNLKHKLLSYF